MHRTSLQGGEDVARAPRANHHPSPMRTTLAAMCAVGALALSTAEAHAEGDGRRRQKGPCPGCVSSFPGGADPRPLLVLLHGDGESAASMLEAWDPSAGARGAAILALSCPRSEGCKTGSFWRWDGDPSWLLRQATLSPRPARSIASACGSSGGREGARTSASERSRSSRRSQRS